IGAIVLGRARVGAGSLVAAGTVVRPGQEIPPGVLVAGVPGRVVRELTDADRATFANTAAQYMRRAARHAEANWNGPGTAAGKRMAGFPRDRPAGGEPSPAGTGPAAMTCLPRARGH